MASPSVLVQGIFFNQPRELTILCFLEQVNRLISKDHLFKDGMIVIKSWSYCESYILGVHHGLISICALETFVCLNGLVCISSFPEVVVEIPKNKMKAGMNYIHEIIWKCIIKFLCHVETTSKSIGIKECVSYNGPLIQFSSRMSGGCEITRVVCLLA